MQLPGNPHLHKHTKHNTEHKAVHNLKRKAKHPFPLISCFSCDPVTLRETTAFSDWSVWARLKSSVHWGSDLMQPIDFSDAARSQKGNQSKSSLQTPSWFLKSINKWRPMTRQHVLVLKILDDKGKNQKQLLCHWNVCRANSLYHMVHVDLDQTDFKLLLIK